MKLQGVLTIPPLAFVLLLQASFGHAEPPFGGKDPKPVEQPNTPAPPPPLPAIGELHQHLEWCIQDKGHPNCPEQYAVHVYVTQCLAAGNRACLMDLAVAAAHRDRCNIALGLSLICQCHNPGAQKVIRHFGSGKTCEYLKKKNSYSSWAFTAAEALTGSF